MRDERLVADEDVARSGAAAVSDERRHLLTRCLRLEARIVALQQELRAVRPGRCNVQPDDRAEIRMLYARGKRHRAIARETGWSLSTVYNVLAQS